MRDGTLSLRWIRSTAGLNPELEPRGWRNVEHKPECTGLGDLVALVLGHQRTDESGGGGRGSWRRAI